MDVYDQLLILGDFNIHVCCSGKKFVSDFCKLLDSFGLTQLVDTPTHGSSHIFDLVLSHGLKIIDAYADDVSLSYNIPVLFCINEATVHSIWTLDT